MDKIKRFHQFHHSVTENGRIQVRIITEYIDNEGNVIDKKYGDAYTPVKISDIEETTNPIEDINGYNLHGWDKKSKDIVLSLVDIEPDPVISGVGIEKQITFDRVIEDDGRLSVRRITRIFDDGKEVSKKFHRSWINPGDNLDNADNISKKIVTKLHTKDVKDAFKLKKNK